MPTRLLAAVRERWNGGKESAPRPHLRDLWADARRFKTDLFDRGGATIETPDPQAGPSALFARTLVQADGDVVCFVTERYGDDAGLRREHDERTAAWFDGLHATVDGVSAATRTITRWVSLLVVAVTMLTVTAVSTIVAGLLVALVTSVAVPAVVRQSLRWLIGRLLSRTVRQPR